MLILVKPMYYSGDMALMDMGADGWLHHLAHPLIRADKHDSPLFTYGTPVQKPEPGKMAGYMHAVAENIFSYSAVQLDYDDGVSMDAFIREYGKEFMFWCYTTHSHGFKGNSDRFRVVVPIETPLLTEDMGFGYTKTMMAEFPGCDPSAFCRAHFQSFPCIREPGAPYRYHVNRHRRKYAIPMDKVRDTERKLNDERMFEHAVMMWKAQFDGDSDEKRIYNQIRWAQNKLDEAREGNRNTTMFSTLMYLFRQGVPRSAIMDLNPPSGCEREWEGMLARIL